MSEKYLCTIITVLIACTVSDAMEPITDFQKADKFGLHIMELGDAKMAPSEVNSAFEGIFKSSMNNDLKIGLIEKIKDDLSDEFPFITEKAKEYIQKISGNDLYKPGQEIELGRTLLRSQNDNILCLDIILKAVRLLHRFDLKGTFEAEVCPFMKKHRLCSYL